MIETIERNLPLNQYLNMTLRWKARHYVRLKGVPGLWLPTTTTVARSYEPLLPGDATAKKYCKGAVAGILVPMTTRVDVVHKYTPAVVRKVKKRAKHFA
jgi:hypothetical protein